MKSTVWIIGAGDEDKDLVPLMLEKQVMLIGPGNDTGNIAIGQLDNNRLQTLPKKDQGPLLRFRDKAKVGHLVVLRLGSVCFSVGAIKSGYTYNDAFSEVYSYWNKKGKSSGEQPWDLQHTKEVDWFVLSCDEALYHFRKGIYGKNRFCLLGDHGKDVCMRAKQKLDAYLISLGYDNSNGKDVLRKIGMPCRGVNNYGFPTCP